MVSPIGTLSTITVLACRDTLVTVRITQRAGQWSCDILRPSPGVVAIEWDAQQADLNTGEVEHIPAFHAAVVQEAWTMGAWDVAVSLYPPGAAPLPRRIDRSCSEVLARSDAAGRIAGWVWRPMRGAPAIRLAQRRPDVTLDADMGRLGPPPAAFQAPDWSCRAARDWIIRLGRYAATQTGRSA